MDKEKEFKKNIKVKTGTLIIGLIMLALGIGLEIFAYLHMKNTTENPIILEDANKEGEYVCLNVESMTDYFATYGTEKKASQKVYFLFDDKYMYMANLNENGLKELESIMEYAYSEDENKEKPEPIKVCGITTFIPSKLKSLAINAYNEMADEKILTNSNFESYLTDFYINTEGGPKEDIIWQSLLIGCLSLPGIALIFSYLKNAKMTKATLSKFTNEMDRIKSDACAPDTLYEKKASIYLTKDYIINFATGFEIYNYNEIIWIYPYEFRQNGVITQKSIYVVTNDSKVHVIANMPTSKKNNIRYDEIYESLLLKVPNALHGYSKENVQKSKEMYKK